MATINTSNGNWMTTFFYEQDLRSLYMNGALNSGFRPGIYNANMCLYTNADTAKGNLGLYLFIKKGTTLIFSNNYTLTKDGYYVRDLDQVGTYLIKCVAQEDISTQLITLTSGSYTSVCEKILGLSETSPAAKTFYIAATMIYDSENSTGYTVPKFRCVLNNPDWKPTLSYTSEDSNYFFTTPDADVYKIPDGSVSYSSRNLISYLFLGAVHDVYWGPTTHYATTSGKWRTGTPAKDWINNHVFIGRGFPEYRQNLTSDKVLNSPEVIPNPNLQTLYLDAPNISVKDRVYNAEADWRGVYNIGAFNVTNAEKFEMKTTDEQSKDLGLQISAFSNKYGITTEGVLVADILFISSRDRYSNVEGTDLESMFYLSETAADPTEGLDYRNKPKFHHLRWLSRCSNEFTGMDPAFEKESDRSAVDTSTITHESYMTTSTVLNGTYITPLDMSEVNRDRLLLLLKNRNVIPAAVNYMRQNGLLDPLKETDLIPAAVFFRKFVLSSGDWVSVDTFSDYGHVDSQQRTHGEKLNPSNILNFFDLQYKTTKINNITTVAPEVFSVIPVME